MLPAQLLSVLHYPLWITVVVPAPSTSLRAGSRKVREGRGTHCCGGFCSLKAEPPAYGLRNSLITTANDGLAMML